MDARERLLAELLAERFYAQPPAPVDQAQVYAQRQRELEQALNGRALIAVPDPPAAAA